jgi:hypothetical protein
MRVKVSTCDSVECRRQLAQTDQFLTAQRADMAAGKQQVEVVHGDALDLL